MAKRKRSRSSRTSGDGNNHDRKIHNKNRSEWLESIDRFIAQVQAFNAGKKAKITIPNPNKNETNKRFIKVDAWEVLKRRA
jgi:hypothetical protein